MAFRYCAKMATARDKAAVANSMVEDTPYAAVATSDFGSNHTYCVQWMSVGACINTSTIKPDTLVIITKVDNHHESES